METVKQLQQRGHRLGTEQPLRLTFYDVEGSEKWRPERFRVSERSQAEYGKENEKLLFQIFWNNIVYRLVSDVSEQCSAIIFTVLPAG